MPLRQDIYEIVAEIIETEAAKDHDEVGVGCSILYLRKPNGDIGGIRIAVDTDGGMSFVFPDISANRLPNGEELDAVLNSYLTELIDAIKVRRAELQAQ